MPVTALALDPEQIAPSEDGKLNPAMEVANSAALEPQSDPTSGGICVTGTSDSSQAIGSEPRASAAIEPDQAPIVEFSAADIFWHSPLGDVLNSLKPLSLAGTHSLIISGLSWGLMTGNFASHPPPFAQPLLKT